MPPQQRNMIHESEGSEISSLSSSKSPVQKRFHFSLSSNEIHPIPHLDSLTDDEVKATWYERGDYEKIKMAMIPLIRKMMKGEIIEETDRETARGLEFRTRQGAVRRQHNKIEAITAVLDEQDRQMEATGRVNVELLSKVYCEFNAHCQVEAHQLALGDVRPAQEHSADAIVLIKKQYQKDEHRKIPQRKSSFGKLIKHMRIRRQPSLPVSDDLRSIAGSAA